jgi:hypothetical protein
MGTRASGPSSPSFSVSPASYHSPLPSECRIPLVPPILSPMRSILFLCARPAHPWAQGRRAPPLQHLYLNSPLHTSPLYRIMQNPTGPTDIECDVLNIRFCASNLPTHGHKGVRPLLSSTSISIPRFIPVPSTVSCRIPQVPPILSAMCSIFGFVHQTRPPLDTRTPGPSGASILASPASYRSPILPAGRIPHVPPILSAFLSIVGFGTAKSPPSRVYQAPVVLPLY